MTTSPNTTRSPKKNDTVLGTILGIVAPLLILAAGIAVLLIAKLNKPAPTRSVPVKSVPAVETVSATVHEEPLQIAVDGSVVPYREEDVVAEVAGRILNKSDNCRAGRVVRKGDLLLEIDPVDYQLEVRRLQEELTQARANLHEIDVELENNRLLTSLAEKDLELQNLEVNRVRKLVKTQAVAESEYDSARRVEIVARNNLQSLRNIPRLLESRRKRLRAAMDLASVKLDQANLDLSRTKIVARMDGVVLSDLVEENSYVQKGTTVLQLEDTTAVEVLCHLRVDQLAWLWRSHATDSSSNVSGYELPAHPTAVIYDVGTQQYQWNGVTSRFDGVGLDRRTRTVPCRILVSDPTAVWSVTSNGVKTPAAGGPPALVRGMFVKTIITIPRSETLIALPNIAVRPGGVVWRVADGRLSIVQVEVAQNTGDQVLVRPGAISVDDRIVTSPLPSAREGMAVREAGTGLAKVPGVTDQGDDSGAGVYHGQHQDNEIVAADRSEPAAEKLTP